MLTKRKTIVYLLTETVLADGTYGVLLCLCIEHLKNKYLLTEQENCKVCVEHEMSQMMADADVVIVGTMYFYFEARNCQFSHLSFLLFIFCKEKKEWRDRIIRQEWYSLELIAIFFSVYLYPLSFTNIIICH